MNVTQRLVLVGIDRFAEGALCERVFCVIERVEFLALRRILIQSSS